MRSEVRWLGLAIVVAVGGWLALRSAPPAPVVSVPSPEGLVEIAGSSAPPAGTAPTEAEAVRIPASSREDDPGMRPPALALSSGTLAWEQQLADATRGRDGTGKARALLPLLPRLPEEALATAAEQAIAALPDRDYAATAAPVVADPKTHPQALAVLFADLMERPDALALPALLAIAREPAHPFAEPALENLRFLLRSEHGRDWGRWDAAIRSRLTPPPPQPE